jgi:hypothetical protein
MGSRNLANRSFCDKFVVSVAGEAYDARVRVLNRKFRQKRAFLEVP